MNVNQSTQSAWLGHLCGRRPLRLVERLNDLGNPALVAVLAQGWRLSVGPNSWSPGPRPCRGVSSLEAQALVLCVAKMGSVPPPFPEFLLAWLPQRAVPSALFLPAFPSWPNSELGLGLAVCLWDRYVSGAENSCRGTRSHACPGQSGREPVRVPSPPPTLEERRAPGSGETPPMLPTVTHIGDALLPSPVTCQGCLRLPPPCLPPKSPMPQGELLDERKIRLLYSPPLVFFFFFWNSYF